MSNVYVYIYINRSASDVAGARIVCIVCAESFDLHTLCAIENIISIGLRGAMLWLGYPIANRHWTESFVWMQHKRTLYMFYIYCVQQQKKIGK